MNPDKIAKLPQWAQSHIRIIQGRLDRCQRMLEEAHPHSRVMYAYLGGRFSVADQGDYEFYFGKEGSRSDRISVRFRDGKLELSSTHGLLVVLPRASNMIHVEVRP